MMRGCRVGVLVLAFAGCASADLRNGAPDASTVDASVDGADAAPMIDAALMQTLAQTQDNIVGAPNISCVNGQGGPTFEVSMYRVFALADHNITNRPFHIKEVVFGVRAAGGSGGGQPGVQVKIGLYSGTMGTASLNVGQIMPAASMSTNATNTTTGVVMTVPLAVTIPANGQFVVEIFSPNLVPTNKFFFVGASASAELAGRGAYYRAPASGCDHPTPVTLASIGQANIHPIIAVTGVY